MGLYEIYYWSVMGTAMILVLFVPKSGSMSIDFIIYVAIIGSGIVISVFPIWLYSTIQSNKYKSEFNRKWGYRGIDAKGRPQR